MSMHLPTYDGWCSSPSVNRATPARSRSTLQEEDTMASRGLCRKLGIALFLLLIAGISVCWSVTGTGAEQSAAPSTPSPASPVVAPPADQPTVKESPEQARRRELTAQHGADVAEAILAGNVVKGMSMEQVRLARGEPIRKDVIPPDAELWHYPAGEVAFSAGRVSYVSLLAKDAALAAIPLYRLQSDPQERSGTTGNEQPTQVPAPSSQVGDTYVYESRDLARPGSGISTRRTVTAANGTVTLSSINLDNKKAKARTLYFDREWNLLSTRSPDGSGREYSPPLKYYDFPLFPGKTWNRTSTETDIKTRATRTHTVSGTVGQWEVVSVPAGTFHAIRVALDTVLFDPATGASVNGTDVSWYVPEVRRSVKSVTTGKDGSQGLIQLLSYQLR